MLCTEEALNEILVTMDKMKLPVMQNTKGSLIPIESMSAILPFEIKRIYFIYAVPGDMVRGNHAHKNLKQLLISVSGKCDVNVSDGLNTKIYTLDDPSNGLLLTGVIWRKLYNFSEDCVLLVLASDSYDEKDYIWDYNEFEKVAAAYNTYV